MAIRNPQNIETGRRDPTPFEKEMADLDRIMPSAEKDLRRIVGPEYDNYTPSQKQFAEELYERRNLFLNLMVSRAAWHLGVKIVSMPTRLLTTTFWAR